MIPDLAQLAASQGPADQGPPDEFAADQAPDQGPPEIQVTPPGSLGSQGDGRAALDILRQMLDLATQYGQVEPDQEDKLEMEQARTLLQKLLAKDQKDMDGMMQGK